MQTGRLGSYPCRFLQQRNKVDGYQPGSPFYQTVKQMVEGDAILLSVLRDLGKQVIPEE